MTLFSTTLQKCGRSTATMLRFYTSSTKGEWRCPAASANAYHAAIFMQLFRRLPFFNLAPYKLVCAALCFRTSVIEIWFVMSSKSAKCSCSMQEKQEKNDVYKRPIPENH